jgi:hypothetical protein
LDLGLDKPAVWRENISGNGTMSIRAGGEGGPLFEIEFTGSGDRWCYPRVDFPSPRDFSNYHGISFDYRCDADDEATGVRLQLIEAGGSAYFTTGGWKATKSWRRAACFFDGLSWGSFSPRDTDGALDTKAIRALLIGINTIRDKVSLEIRKVRLVNLGG